MPAITTLFGEGGSGTTPYESGSPTLAEALRALIDDNIETRAQFNALLAKLDSELSLEEILELINDAKAKYEAHRILTGGGEHGTADATNAVTAADATDLATGYTLANDLKVQLNAHNAAASEVEESVTLLNEIKVDYEAHRVLVGGGEHPFADSVNAVTAADATDEATAYTLANDLKTQFNAHGAALSELEEAIILLNEIKADYEAHRILTAGSVHGAADTTNVVSSADATDLASAITLANEIKVDYEAHRVLTGGGEHTVADAVNVVTAANASDLGTLVTLANDLRVQYEAHRVYLTGPCHGAADATNVVAAPAVPAAAVHLTDDVTNVIAAPDATTFATLKALANELRTDYEAHRIDTTSHGAADATNAVAAVAVGTAGVHQTDDVTNVVSSPDATTQATLNTLANEIRTDYEAHRVDTTSHGAADGTNVITEPAAATDYAATLTPAALTTTKG